MSPTAPQSATPSRLPPSSPVDTLPPPDWADTQPARLDSTPKKVGPFREALKGLQVRELAGETVFQEFFG